MSSLTSRFTAALAGILVFCFTSEAIAYDAESLRLQRDLRACIDKSVARVNSQKIGDVTGVLSSCDAELQAFMASITDSTRLEAVRFAISGYVQASLEPAQVARDTRG